MNPRRHARLRKQQAVRKFLRQIRRDIHAAMCAELKRGPIFYDAEGYERIIRAIRKTPLFIDFETTPPWDTERYKLKNLLAYPVVICHACRGMVADGPVCNLCGGNLMVSG